MNHVVYYIGGPLDLTKQMCEGRGPQDPRFVYRESKAMSTAWRTAPGLPIDWAYKDYEYVFRQIADTHDGRHMHVFAAVAQS